VAKRESLSVTVTDKSEFIGMNPGPLVLVNPILEKMDIRKIVNLHCPADTRLEIPVGDVIYALVANRLCSPEPLMHVGEWADYSGAEFLLGTPAEALNDDRLARALDAIFLKRWNILADIALHVSKHFKVSLAKLHYDPTSFHFTGEYNEQSNDPSLLPSIKPFKIEVGRHASPGHHIKEAQVGVNLANDGKGPVPFFYHSADGSANKNLQHLLKYLKPKRLLMVTDRGCFNAEHAIRMVRVHHFDFISSLSWNNDLSEMYNKKKPQMKESSFISINEKRKRDDGAPEETWERYFIGEIPSKITYEKEVEKESGGKVKEKQSIRIRLVYVYSTADMKVCRKTRAKYTEKIKKGLAQIQSSVENGYQKEIQAVHRKVNTLYGRKQARNYFTYQVEELAPSEILTLPPRRRGQRKPTLRFSYQYHPELARKDAQYDGLYAIGTSLREKTHSTDDVFIAFKEQHHIETAHHQWKAPIRLRPLFLKKVTRIESLVFVQFLALMAFYLLQRLYRLSKGKTCRTTGETLLKHFVFSAIVVSYEKNTVRVTPLPLKPAQTDVLVRLKFPFIEEQIRSYVTRPEDAAEYDKGRDI
jgi:transposase